jgi:hypothetical protein
MKKIEKIDLNSESTNNTCPLNFLNKLYMYPLYCAFTSKLESMALYLSTRRTRKHQEVLVAPSDSSLYRWSVVIKNNGQVYSDFEEDDLGKIGYRIYTELEKPNHSSEIYIRENSKKQLLWINKDYESDYMFGVDNPEGRRIGYLPFSRVASI